MKTLALALASAALAFATPAVAQEFPLQAAEYVDVSGIHIDDGHSYDYAMHLATIWRSGQDFAVEQGWITGYEILINTYPREGEPDVYLLTRFTEWASSEEDDQRQIMYQQHMQQTLSEMEAASGERAQYRQQGSDMLLRRMVWKD